MSEQDAEVDGQDDAELPPEDGSPTVSDPDQSSFLEAGDAAPAPDSDSDPDPVEAASQGIVKKETGGDYRVLARKYRPQNFDDLF